MPTLPEGELGREPFPLPTVCTFAKTETACGMKNENELVDAIVAACCDVMAAFDAPGSQRVEHGHGRVVPTHNGSYRSQSIRAVSISSA